MIHLSWVVSLQWPLHLYPTLAMVAGSCVPSGTPEALVCPPCGVTVQFSLRFSVFTFHPYLRIRCFGCCYAPSNSLQRSVCYVPILGTCLWCCLSSLTGLCAFVSGLLPHSPADDIVFAGSCHCQYGLGSYRLSLPWSPLWLGMIAFLTSRSWSPSRSRSPRSFPRSFLVTSLADFAAGLDYDLLLCPVRALRLYLLRARSLSTGRHRLFVSPRRPARPFLRTRCRSFGGGNCCCSGG